MAFEWIFKMRDRISGPARRATRNLRAMTSTLRESRRALNGLNHGRSRATYQTGRGSFGGSFFGGGGASSGGGGAAGMVGALRSIKGLGVVAIVGAVVGKLAEALTLIRRIGGAVADVAARLGQMVIQASAFRSRALFGLELITGSRGAARQALDEARRLSEFLGTDLHETIAGIQGLMSRGFSQRGASGLFQAIADLRAISADPIDTGRIVTAIGQIQQAGHLNRQDFNQLVNANLPIAQVRQALARNLNTTLDQVDRLMSQRRISSAVAIRSIMQGIAAQTGRDIGGAAREMSQTLPGLLARLQQAPQRLFFNVAEIVDRDGALGQLREMLRSILGLLDPASSRGRTFAEVIGGTFSTMVQALRTAWDLGRALFDGVFGNIDADPLTALRDGLGGVRAFLVELRAPENVRRARAFGETLRSIGIAIWPLIRGIGYFIVVLGGVVAVLAAVAVASLAVGTALSALVTGGIGIAIDGVLRFAGVIGNLILQAPTWGIQLVQGFINGITTRVASLQATASSLGGTVLGAVTQRLGIRSPSREMQYLGEMTGAGYQRGLDASLPSLDGFGLPRGGAGGLGGGGMTVNGPLVHLEVTGADASSSADDLADALRRILVPELQTFAGMLPTET